MPGFISSPDLAKRAAGLAKVNPTLVVRDAAVVAAGRLVTPMRAAASNAGGKQLASAVQVHDGHLNDLVMRDRGQKGDVIVGVSGEHRQASSAEELEWGGVDSPPTAWVRSTASQHGSAIVSAWSNALTRELDRKVLGT